MQVPFPDDRALVKQLLRGDEAAFTQFFDGMFPRVYRFALARVNGREDAAEEIAQATLCRVVRTLPTWRGEAALFTWICAICRREIEDWRRTDGQLTTVDLLDDTSDVRAALESIGSSDSTHLILEQSQRAELVRRLLDYLPDQYARILEWKYFDDTPVRTIAERLGVSEKAAESLLTRARTAFRDLISSVAPGLRPSTGGTS